MKKTISIAALVLFGISLNASAGNYFPDRDKYTGPKPTETPKKPYQIVPFPVFQDGQVVLIDYVIHTYYDEDHFRCAIGGMVVESWLDLNSNLVVDGEETLTYSQVTCTEPYRHVREIY